jgi:enoyl-CoA hydratase/carnithine racemase
MNRPANFNALSEEMLAALQGALDRLAQDEAVRVVVLGAAGKAFCPGHNLKEMIAEPALDYYQRLFAQCSRMMLSIQKLPVPVIARVQGIATAAGCQLVAQCDLAGGLDRSELRRQRRELRPVLLHAQRAAAAQHRAQAGHGNAGHR